MSNAVFSAARVCIKQMRPCFPGTSERESVRSCSMSNLFTWISTRCVKEIFIPSSAVGYPYMSE